MKKANNTRMIKKANLFLVYDAIKTHEPLSVEDIVRHTMLSRPTVLSGIAELVDDTAIKKSGFGQSFGGRQPALYSLNSKPLRGN